MPPDRSARQGRRDRVRLHSRNPTAARFASPARSAARSIAPSATPARRAGCATSRPPRSSRRFVVARDRLGDFPGGVAARPTALVPIGRRRARGVQHRVHGHGRAALQFRRRPRRDRRADRRRRACRCRSAASPSRPPASCRRWTRLGADCGTMLAVSLHATNDALRDKLVPLNRKYPIARAHAGLPRLSRRLQRAAHHLRICDAEGRQRQRPPRPARWCGCCKACRPRST